MMRMNGRLFLFSIVSTSQRVSLGNWIRRTMSWFVPSKVVLRVQVADSLLSRVAVALAARMIFAISDGESLSLRSGALAKADIFARRRNVNRMMEIADRTGGK